MLFLLFSYWSFSSFYVYNILTTPNEFNKTHQAAIYEEMKASGATNPEKAYHYSCVLVSVFMGWYFFPRDIVVKVKKLFKGVK